MVLPELLARVLAAHALEDLAAAGVVVQELCRATMLVPILPSRQTYESIWKKGVSQGKEVGVLVTSYTAPSMISHTPSASVLCLATSAAEKDLDILAAWLFLFPKE